MLVPLLSLALLQTPTWSDRAVLRAELIVVGKVERVFRVPNPGSAAQTPGAVVVKVSETFVGPEGTSELLVLTHAQVDRPSPLLLGTEAVLFLAKARDPEGRLRQRFVKQGAPDRAPMQELEGVQRVEGCPWMLPPGAMDELARLGLEARPEQVRTLFAQSIARVLPTLEASYISSGPANWSLRLDARGNLEVGGQARTQLDPDALAKLLRAIDTLEPATLPELIRTDWPPCSSSYQLELRSRNGLTRVKAYHGELSAKATAEERAAHARFKELWKLLPGEGKPDGLP